MRFTSSFLAICLSTAISGPATAGPFGLDYETFSLSQFNCTAFQGNFFECKNVPKPHPDIETYVVQYSEGVGLCMIKGISKDIGDSIYGDSTQRKTNEVYDQLSRKYGEGEKVDILRPGSIWDEPDDWMMGILEKERTYAALWYLSEPIDGVSEIALGAQATRRDTGYFIVEFYHANNDECDKAQSSKAAESF